MTSLLNKKLIITHNFQVILHPRDAVETTTGSVVIRSPAADTDIFVIAVTLLSYPRVYLDFGVGKHRKGLWLEKIQISDDLKKCLIGFHAFTGNDYVSSFFRKGKSTCYKVMKGSNEFREAFASLGDNWNVIEESSAELEKFVCKLYGYNKRDVSKVRKKIFDKKCKQEGIITDLSVMPPCKSVLRLHTNYVAKIWKSSMENEVDCPDITRHGWNEDGSIKWVESIFPEDIEEILLNDNYEEDFDMDVEDTLDSSDYEDDEI